MMRTGSRRRGIAPILIIGLLAAGLAAVYLFKDKLGFGSQSYSNQYSPYGSQDPYYADPYYAGVGQAALAPGDMAADGLPQDGAHRERWRKHLDTDGDGTVSEEERAAARQRFMARADTDGDGVLSDAEKAAMRERRGAGRGGRGVRGAMAGDPELKALFEAARAAHKALEESLASGDPAAIASARGTLEAAQEALKAKRGQLQGS